MVLASLALIAVAYFGFMRPAQQHMLSLERQCNKLVVAVKNLQSRDDTARHGLQLINLLDAQSEKLASAEKVVAQFSALHDQMMQEADEMVQATAALQQMKAVRADIDQYGTALADAVAKLGEMLPQAEETLAQVDQLCGKLTDESESLAVAQKQLGQLAGLKQEVLEQSANVPAAEAALDQIWDLKEGLLQSKGTLDKVQKLTVEMMLLEPVLDRVAKSLQPTSEATRLSRRAAAKAPKTRQTANSTEAASPWASAMNVFVALLGNNAE